MKNIKQNSPKTNPKISGVSGAAPKNSNPKNLQYTPGSVITPISTASSKKSDQINSQKKFSFRNKIIALLLLCGMAMATIVAGLLIQNSRSNNLSTSNTDDSSISARSYDEFSTVCSGKTISNAKQYSDNPKIIALFEKSSSSQTFSSANNYIVDASWVNTNNDISSINIVGCLTHSNATTTDIVCNVINDNNEAMTLKLVSVDYNLAVYEANNGTVLGQFNIPKNSPAECPEKAYYSKNDTELYTVPDLDYLNNVLSEFIGER